MTRGSRRLLSLVLQAVVLGVVFWFAAKTLSGQWDSFRVQAVTLRPRWGAVFGSALLVLATYGLLVESWRTLVRAWGDRLSYADATRIWAVANLGRYVPGKLWSIGAMGVMAQRAGVSPLAAAGSAVLGTVVNLAAGLIVLALASKEVVAALFPAATWLSVLAPVLGVLGLLAIPVALPLVTRVAARVAGRAYEPVRVPLRALVIVVAANVASWVLYGVAFRWLAGALLPDLAGKWGVYVAVFAGSYLAGYLALVVPGGLGVRELSMAAALVRVGTDVPSAALLAVASRLWLTVLELTPGFFFLARGALRSASRSRPDASV